MTSGPTSSIQSATTQEVREGRVMLATVVAGHAMKHLLNSAFFILLPELKTGLGLTNAGVGTLATFRSVAGGLANLPAGFIADWLQHRWPVILALSVSMVGLFYLVLGSAQSFPLVVVAGALSSVAITFYHPPAIAALSRRFAERRGLAISLHGTGGSIGEALGPVVAGGLLAVIGWRLIFQMSALPAVLFGLSIWLLLRRLPVQRRDDTSFRTYLGAYRGALGRLLTNRRILGVLLVVAGFSATQASVMTFLPIYLREEVGYSTIRTGVYLSAAQVVGIVSQPVMGLLSDRHGRKAVLLPGILILSVTVFSLYVAPADIPLLLAMVAMGAVLFPLMSILLAAAGDVAGEELQATTVGLVFASAVIFSGVSPLISGLLADAYGVKTVFLYGGGLAATTAVVLGVQRWPGRRLE